MLKTGHLSAILVYVLIFTNQGAFAKGPKKDFKTKTVIITDAQDVRHTGFVAKYQGKTVIICNDQAFGVNYKITDLADKAIDYTGVIIPSPKLKRGVIFIQLSDEAKLPAFELEEKIAETVKPGTGISVQGIRKDKKKVSGGKGVVTEVKENRINLRCKVIFELTGAPVVSNDTGKVIGVAVSKKKKRFEIPYAMRIDNIKESETLTKEAVETEIANCEELYNLLIGYAGIFTEISKTIKDSGLTNPKLKFKHIHPDTAKQLYKKLDELKKQLADEQKVLSKALSKIRKLKEAKLPAIKLKFKQNLERANEIVERKYEAKDKQVEEILKKLDKRANALD